VTERQTDHLDRVTDAFFAVDEQWRFTYLNEGAEELFSASREELRGQVIWDEFPETVETQFPDGFYAAMENQEPVTFEVLHAPLDTWFEVRAYPSESGISVFLQDVTDEKRRRIELSRYETIVEAVSDGVITLDEDHRVTFVNDAVVRGLGIDREDVVGEHVEELASRTGVDPERLSDFGHAIDALKSGNASYRSFEAAYYDRDGQERVSEMRMVPLEGDAGTVAGVTRDITDRREYERVITSLHEVSRQLFGARDDLEIASIVVHAAGDILDLPISGVWLLNDEYGRLDPVAATAGAHEELGGLPQFEENEGLAWDAYRRDRAVLYDDVSTEDGRYEEDSPIRSEIIVPIGDHGVLMAGAVEPEAFDETDLQLASTLAANAEAAFERAERDELLRSSKEELGRQSERLDAVSDVISRDVTERIGEARAELPADSAADEKLEQAERLLDDVLEFARGRTTVGPRESVRLSEAARAAADRVEGNGALSVTVAEDATLRADAERFSRLFEALYETALERSDGDVAVTVELLDDGIRGFAVRDDGPVIPEAARDRAFEVGYGASDDETGLGLAVAREIVEAHNWTVEVDDDYEAGTRVVVGDVPTLEPAE